MADVNDVLIQFEENINHVDPTGLKPFFQATKGIDKETDKLYI